MKIIYSFSFLLAVATLTACAGTPDRVVVQKPEMMKKCMAESAAKLAGTTLSTETEIKSKTHAEVVRLVAPGQPITKDYHPRRVTVIADPQTKTVLKAFCG